MPLKVGQDITASRKRLAVFIGLAFLLVGCAGGGSYSVYPSPFTPEADAYAEARGWQKRNYQTPQGFRLTGYRSPLSAARSDRLVVFIERDGAWISRTEQARDPTPDNTDMIRLAVNDPSPNKLYLGRPCMYLTTAELARCSPQYWNLHRYAPEALDAMSAAIDQEIAASGARDVFLVGWSGGGAVAALLAARRNDVVGFATIAANVDHAAWTRVMGVTPMRHSLNPADFADRLEKIPQTHFIGGQDDVVPASVAQSYRARFRDASRLRIVTIARFDHDCCWARDWAELAREARLYE